MSSTLIASGSALLPLAMVLLHVTDKRLMRLRKVVVSMEKIFKKGAPSALAAAMNVVGILLILFMAASS